MHMVVITFLEQLRAELQELNLNSFTQTGTKGNAMLASDTLLESVLQAVASVEKKTGVVECCNMIESVVQLTSRYHCMMMSVRYHAPCPSQCCVSCRQRTLELLADRISEGIETQQDLMLPPSTPTKTPSRTPSKDPQKRKAKPKWNS